MTDGSREELLAERRRLTTERERLARGEVNCPSLWGQGEKCVVEGRILDETAFRAELGRLDTRLGELDAALKN